MNRNIIPATPTEVGDAEALFGGQDEQIIDGAAEAVEPQPDDATIFWSNKRPVVVPKGRASANVSSEYSGFLVPTDQNPMLDEAFAIAGAQAILISHSDGDREHWCLPTATLFLIAQGLQSSSQMRDTTERLGIAYGRHLMRDAKTKEVVVYPQTGKPKTQSVLKFRCFLPQLVAAGYYEPLRLSISGTMTDDILHGLTRQYAVLRIVRDLRQAKGLAPVALPFWSYALTFEPGASSNRGIAKVIPPTVRLPQPIDLAYLKAHRVTMDIAELIKACLDDTVTWSIEESARINADSQATNGGAGGARNGGDETPWPGDADAPAAPSYDAEGNPRPF